MTDNTERRSSTLLLAVLFFGIAILYLPILVLIGYSFNASPLVNVWGGFSTEWYGKLLHNRQLLQAALLSLEVAVAASTGAVILGTLAATALVRFARFRGRLLLTAMVNAPLVMPEIITGITQLLLFVSMMQLFSWPHRGFTTIVLSHITFCTAYVTITVQSRLAAADRSLEEAAMDLGASPTRAFVEITLPIIAPAIMGRVAFTGAATSTRGKARPRPTAAPLNNLPPPTRGPVPTNGTGSLLSRPESEGAQAGTMRGRS